MYSLKQIMDVFQENLSNVKTGHFQEKVALEILELSRQGLFFPQMTCSDGCATIWPNTVWQSFSAIALIKTRDCLWLKSDLILNVSTLSPRIKKPIN